MKSSVPIRKRLFPLYCLALLASLYLLHHHLEVRNDLMVGESICSINAFIDCDSVAQSSFSEIFGIPIALFAIAFYFFMCCISFRKFSDTAEQNHLLLFMNFLAALVSIVMLTISVIYLGKICLFCCFLYVIGIFAFALSAFLKEGWSDSILKRLGLGLRVLLTRTLLQRPAPLIAAVGLFIALILGQASYVELVLRPRYLKYYDASVISQLQANWEKEKVAFPESEVTNLTGTLQIGPSNAPIKIVEFFDYECPFCKRVSPILLSIQQKHSENVSLTMLQYPLDKSCNKFIHSKMHEFACDMAGATVCSAVSDSPDDAINIHEQFMSTQIESKEDIKAITQTLGLDIDTCLKSTTTKDALNSQLEFANRLQVNSTPSIYVNGKKIEVTAFFQIELLLGSIVSKLEK